MQHQTFPFPHNRLEVFLVSLEMASQAKRVADRVPRGHRSLADQLLRSSGSTVLLIPKGWRSVGPCRGLRGGSQDPAASLAGLGTRREREAGQAACGGSMILGQETLRENGVRY